MLQSKLFTKTRKEVDKSEPTINAQLLGRGGFVDKTMAGVYTYLPLGLKVLRKIENIVREEMDNIGGQEILMPALHPSENWKQTGGWDNIDVLFKLESRTGREYALGQSEEEIVTPTVKNFVLSYKDLPVAVYQIQNKYRDELRAKSGVLRGREFGMKDMYSFHASQEDFDQFYNTVKDAYFKVYERCGLKARATEASGGSFSDKVSYEFMVLTDAGEDDILYSDTGNYCVNTEITELKEGDASPDGAGTLKKAKASEAGNVFDLGQKYCKDFNLMYTDKEGNRQYPIMGCYGIGVTRLLGISVEKNHDDKGIIWPKTITPFELHLVNLSKDKTAAESFYKECKENGIDVLFDDRDESAGQKLAEADLLGISVRAVISDKTNGKVEWKERASTEVVLLEKEEFIKKVKEFYSL